MYIPYNSMVENKEDEKKNFLKEIKEATETLRVEREATEKVIAEAKELKAFEILGGKADAGQPAEKPIEETPKDYADRLLAGKVEVD